MTRVVAAVAAAALLAGCGGAKQRAAPDAGCSRDAAIIGTDALAFVHHLGTPYPSDLYYYDLRPVLDGYAAKCPPALLRSVLVRRLTRAQRRALVANLPHAMARYLRRVLS